MTPHSTLSQLAHKVWRNKGVLSSLLLPFSWLVGLVVKHKIRRFRTQAHRSYHPGVPVIVVGNIYTGGTGKTPVVMAIVQALQKQGWHPGVVSRGYGVRVGHHPRTGQGDLSPTQFGDEPALIARSTHIPVSIHPLRAHAAQALRRDYPAIDIIVSDDGLQHLKLARDIEVIVQDDRGIGNGRLLPAGPLREPAARLEQVDVVITNSSRRASAIPGPYSHPNGCAHRPVHARMTLEPRYAVHLSTGIRMTWNNWVKQQRAPIAAVAAIGNPDRYFDMLRQHGLDVALVRALPDHSALDSQSFQGLNSSVIAITAKDAVKCSGIADSRLWSIEVVPCFSNSQWLECLTALLHQTTRTRHGI